MGLFTGMDISGSGLTAQRLRMDIISNNIANQDTTRSGQVDANGKPIPYRREFPVFQAGASFNQFLNDAGAGMESEAGVKVASIAEDNSPFPTEYDPGSPDANAQGYVQMPNVNLTQEMADMVDASSAYEANISALNTTKEMCSKALTIGQ